MFNRFGGRRAAALAASGVILAVTLPIFAWSLRRKVAVLEGDLWGSYWAHRWFVP